MITFGQKNAILRKDKSQSQGDLGTKLNTSVSVISRYERDEMQTSIEAAKKNAKLIDTTVGYLLGETEETNLFKDPSMLKRLNEITHLPEWYKEHILYTIDHLLASVKTRQAYA